jgi:GT2 family glycosyltransferase
MNAEKQNSIDQLQTMNAEKQNSINQLQTMNAEKQNSINQLQIMNNHLQAEYQTVENNYQAILNSEFWKITKPFRVLLSYIKRILKHIPVIKYVYKFLSSIKNEGLKEAVKRIKCFFQRRKYSFESKHRLIKSEIEIQRATRFSRSIKFSVLVPLFNTPPQFLNEMIISVKEQTYENWELCLADGSDKEHAYVQNVCENHVKSDNRIRYKKLDNNSGISNNTNECIYMSTGEYIALLDHDDLLHPSALYEIMKIICEKEADIIYTDEDKVDSTTKTFSQPHFKPDFAIDNLRAYNYICHLTVFKKSMLDKVGLFDPACDGAQDHDMILRLAEKAEKIVHIPNILYHWRITDNSTSSGLDTKPYVGKAGILAVSSHLKRCGLDAEAISVLPTLYRIKYGIVGNPLISIIIPNNDHVDDLKKCISSIINKSTYSNYEIIVVENGSKAKETFEFYDRLNKLEIKVVFWDGGFNYPAINNFGRSHASGDYIVLMNNDIEIISPDWIEEMLMLCQRQDVGAVGAKLYYYDDTIQHGGVILGIGGVAGHSHRCFPRSHVGYFCRLIIQQDLSAVTAACIMVKAKVFDEVQGLDSIFAVAFNDVDFCMRIRKAGYLIVWTPYAEAYHYESKSRGYENTPEKIIRFGKEISLFKNRWAKELSAGDPYYNMNLTLDREDFSQR